MKQLVCSKATETFPQRAVTELQGSHQVMIVDARNKVHVQNVTVGERLGSDWIIEKGLKAGDRVIVEGLQKAKEGAVVSTRPFKEQPELTPTGREQGQ